MNIYDIARLAGVSSGTVSRVINGKRDVSKKTREKILKIMNENNFTPRISSAKGNTIALFVPLGKERTISSPYLASLLSGIGDYLFENDYRLLIVSTNIMPRKEYAFLQFCLQNNIDGGIFVLSDMNDKYIANVANKLPTVVIGNHFDNAKLTSVCYDAYSGCMEAVKYLYEFGHRDITFMYSGIQFYDTASRIKGFKDALRQYEIKPRSNTMFCYDDTSETDIENFIDNIISRSNRPTAMLIQNDTQALQVINILNRKSIKIPDDISIIGFDNLSFAQYTTPPLTTIGQPIYDEGKKGAKEIINMINSVGAGTYMYKNIVLKPKLVLRGTVGPANSQTSTIVVAPDIV